MKVALTVCLAVAALAAGATAQVKKAVVPQTKVASPAKRMTLKDLPPEVQKTVRDETTGAALQNIGRETEDGVAQYEVETIRNGKHRDFNVDTKGKILLVEEEITVGSVPAAARAAILNKVADGKLGMVELLNRGGETMYEAGYTSKDGKKHEVLVKPDGAKAKE
jgi:uncharacterized membrane protein YkoI